MHIDYTLVATATLAQFVLGALWYSPLAFGKTWMEIMEVTKVAQKNLKKMQQEMLPFYILQLVLTTVSTLVLALFIGYTTMTDPDVPACVIAILLWFGYIVPMQVASVIWGKTKKKFWLKQILIMTLGQLVSVMLAVSVLSL